MWESIKTAFRIPEIRKKIWWTVFLLAVFRLGSYIVVPGMSSFDLGEHGLFSLLDMFSGGALSNMSLFALGVQPYITSSIILSLLVGALVGAWQGFWVAYVGIPAFIVTLAGMLIFRGALTWLSNSISLSAVTPRDRPR